VGCSCVRELAGIGQLIDELKESTLRRGLVNGTAPISSATIGGSSSLLDSINITSGCATEEGSPESVKTSSTISPGCSFEPKK
jgi:hypothetical protein